MRKIQRFYAFFTAAIISLSISLVAVPAYAQQVQAGKMLQESIEATKVSTSAMDQMWVDLFAPDSLLYNQIVKISTILLIFGFFFVLGLGMAVPRGLSGDTSGLFLSDLPSLPDAAGPSLVSGDLLKLSFFGFGCIFAVMKL